MKISQLLEADNPIPVDPKYNAETADLSSWVMFIEKTLDEHDSDEFIKIIDVAQLVNEKKLFATQSWIDYEYGGGDPVIEKLDDKPVIVLKNGICYILDGHHRCASSFKSNRKISAYLFEL